MMGPDTVPTPEEAEAAGGLSFLSGTPCTAPDYGKESLRAKWRIGWQKARAKSGATPWPPPGCPYLNPPGVYCPNCDCGAFPTAAAIPAAIPAAKIASKVGWLIETKHIDGTPWWWNGKLYDDDDWTKDNLEALAFASKEDAEKIIRQIGWTTVVATEHRWG